MRLRAQRIIDSWRELQARERMTGHVASDGAGQPAQARPEGQRLQISTLRAWLPAHSAVEAITPSTKPPAFPDREVVPLEPALDALELEVRVVGDDEGEDGRLPLILAEDAGVPRSPGLFRAAAARSHVPHAAVRTATIKDRLDLERGGKSR